MPEHKSTKQQIIERLTTRNIVTLATVATFLFAVVFSLLNAEVIIETIDEAPNGVVLGGGIIIGTFVAVVKDVYTFYYRKSQAKESKE